MRGAALAIALSFAFLAGPECARAADAPASAQPVDEAKVAEIQALLQKWAQLHAGMTLDDVESIVGPLAQREVIEAMARTRKLAPPAMQDMPDIVNMSQEIRQSYTISGSTLTFKLVFNAKRKLVKYGLDNGH